MSAPIRCDSLILCLGGRMGLCQGSVVQIRLPGYIASIWGKGEWMLRNGGYIGKAPQQVPVGHQGEDAQDGES